MAKEIERKFLVKDQGYRSGTRPLYIHQGFISTDKEKVVRVRIYGTRGFIALKGSNAGIIRTEYEYEIPVEDAHEILRDLCLKPTIEKFRYEVEYAGHTWEVDEFMKENSGLVIAEIELGSEDEPFEKPPWLGEEVSGDPRYYNVNLVEKPFRNW